MPDGSHWALQSWKRLMPNGGYKCCQTPQQGKRELHISHWKGPLAQLWLKWNWTRATSQYPHLDKLFGRATYKGVGTYGFSNTRTGAPTDSFGRVVFVDTYNPPKWGKGWRRENSFLVHRPSDGGFCDTLWPNRYGRHHASGYGQKYRATMDGPGVTPIVRWKGPPPGQLLAVARADPRRPGRLHDHRFRPTAVRCADRLPAGHRAADPGGLVRRQVLRDPLAPTR